MKYEYCMDNLLLCSVRECWSAEGTDLDVKIIFLNLK